MHQPQIGTEHVTEKMHDFFLRLALGDGDETGTTRRVVRNSRQQYDLFVTALAYLRLQSSLRPRFRKKLFFCFRETNSSRESIIETSSSDMYDPSRWLPLYGEPHQYHGEYTHGPFVNDGHLYSGRRTYCEERSRSVGKYFAIARL